MKKIQFTILMTLFMAINAIAQHHELNKLDKEVELTLDSAAKHMVKFVLTQNEEEYNKANDLIAKAETLNNELISKMENAKGVGANIENEIIEDRKEEIASYKNPGLKASILAEKKTTKTENVKFHGESYKLSKKGKSLYDTYISYLPKN